MTILPSPLAQSTLGEKCALYLDHVSDHLPVFLHSLRPRLDPYLTYSTTTLRSVAQALPFDVDEQTTAIGAALLLGLLAVVAMSWGNPFNNFWRRSPNYPPAAPQVRDDDYSYITPEYIVDPPSQPARYGAQYEAGAAENEPDIICLKHRGTIYPLHFRAYAIDDGLLTVGDLRHTAAAKMGASNPNQIRLLYKGNLLKDDARTCKAEGLKQHSQVLCVVSEAGSNTPSDLSDYDSAPPDIPVIRPGSSSSLVDGDDAPGPANPASKKKNKKKKKKGGKRSEERLAPEALAPSPSLAPPRPTSAGRSAAPSPSPSMKTLKTPLDQVTALTEYFKRELIPLCNEYLADPPTDPKKREFEYRKLSETILAQVMLKADGIEPDGNETVRNARKALIREAQASLNRLDEVGKQQP